MKKKSYGSENRRGCGSVKQGTGITRPLSWTNEKRKQSTVLSWTKPQRSFFNLEQIPRTDLKTAVFSHSDSAARTARQTACRLITLMRKSHLKRWKLTRIWLCSQKSSYFRFVKLACSVTFRWRDILFIRWGLIVYRCCSDSGGCILKQNRQILSGAVYCTVFEIMEAKQSGWHLRLTF